MADRRTTPGSGTGRDAGGDTEGGATVPGEPARKVSVGWMSLLAMVQMGIVMASTTGGQILLPSHVERIDPLHKEASLAVVFAAGAVFTAVANPVFGALSDRTVGRFGRRRPWIVAGALLCAASLVFLGGQNSLGGLVAGWCLAQLSFTAMMATAVATVPDQVPIPQRGKVSALAGVGQLTGPLLGGLVVTMAVTGLFPGYVAVAALVLLAVLPFGLFTREAPIPRSPGRGFDPRAFVTGFWISPRRHPDFAWAWLSRFLINLTLSMGIGYLLFFLRDAVRYERLFPGSTAEQGVLVLVTVFTLSSVAPGLIAGWLSDRIGRRRPVVFVGGLTMGASALVLTVLTSWPAAIAAAALLGAGTGMFASVDQALVTQLLPAATDRAKDLGVVSLANSAASVLGPVIAAPLVTSAGGYPLMYGVAAASAACGAVLVWKIRGVR
ncbi:MFS transporter [Microtetraspora malaysiensis]|uniref:MFS transporter n=1 Tax=Microtetraspora malaysiensis TaxID=161358 RepID=UPI000AE8933A|nr:MFS transporter [Microtetraspora malaysiensis]